MVTMLGDSVLPEAIQSRRRRLRVRLQDVREPIRSRREDLVPGPDVIGMTEEQVASLRDRVVQRDGISERLPDLGSDGSSSSSGNSGSSGSTKSTVQ